MRTGSNVHEPAGGESLHGATVSGSAHSANAGRYPLAGNIRLMFKLGKQKSRCFEIIIKNVNALTHCKKGAEMYTPNQKRIFIKQGCVISILPLTTL